MRARAPALALLLLVGAHAASMALSGPWGPGATLAGASPGGSAGVPEVPSATPAGPSAQARWQQARDLEPVLCVLDTGIDPGHVDLEGRVVAWADFLRGRPAPYDDNGHGSHVAGTAAGAGAAQAGVEGVAPRARLAVGKVMDERGRGTSVAAARGVEWCVEQGALVVNLSLEEEDCVGRHGLAEAIERALGRGTLVVTSAGNRGSDACAIHTPGSLASVLTVGALGGSSLDTGWVAGFSGRGAQQSPVKLDLVAPGAGVRAAHAGTSSGVKSMEGTSMATPFVAGAAALLRAAHPGTSPAEVAEALRRTARDGGPEGPDPAWGWGVVDPAAALAWLDARRAA